MRISVAGTGYVGLVAGVCFAERGHQVTCVDQDQAKVDMLEAGRAPIHEEGLEALMRANREAGRLSYTTDHRGAYGNAEAIFIGVGTPELPDGSADLSHIAQVARQIAESIRQDCLVVVKSTVPVGTNHKVEQFIHDFLPARADGRKLRVEVASNPEFLAQGTAVRDTLQAARVVIGTDSAWAEGILQRIYAPFGLPVVSVSRRSAEMVKYAANNFLALKISYMNDIANLCERVGADILEVAEGMRHDRRIGGHFLGAGIGYGGSCFPKDTKALEHLGRQHNYRLRTVQAAIDVNEDQRTLLFRKARNRLISFRGLKVAVLGLTFKPGTDDLRGAPALSNIPLLLEQGALVTAYDPAGQERCRALHPEGEEGEGGIRYANSVREALEGAGACFVFTEWPEILSLSPQDFKQRMRTPLVYDGRNIYDRLAMLEAGVEYHAVGRRP
ncbi:UDP-glucose dehydrogenase family protein [Anaerotalea alkaliphila]|uniref:UDP-glucose 6-dehydrogenase n=1 Tax=Anaerotalea alkaliphila TaxID=2662126 RepID=A0A7X5HUN7_9FIRM|nr:UDP-glucose/GDP-mannose dehydrogenase family protein [Anaerotalea alkaliphila]NDL66969.1 UDP-glucose/GDP-mannose dehydrogenase family protein [Anaerotalea alkaliphila]